MLINLQRTFKVLQILNYFITVCVQFIFMWQKHILRSPVWYLTALATVSAFWHYRHLKILTLRHTFECRADQHALFVWCQLAEHSKAISQWTSALNNPRAFCGKHLSVGRAQRRPAQLSWRLGHTVRYVTMCVVVVSSYKLCWLLFSCKGFYLISLEICVITLPVEKCEVLWWVCLLVFLSTHVSRKSQGKTSSIFCACWLWPCLGSPLVAM